MADKRDTALRRASLRLRFSLLAVVLSAAAIAAAATLYFGMQAVAARLDAAVVAERRMARYSTLSTRVSTLLVIATEAVQTERPASERLARLSSVSANIEETFDRLHGDLEAAVAQAEALGIDQQSRFGTQSLGLARMQALLQRMLDDLSVEEADQARLRATIDSFASTFDPLLNQAVNTEVVFRTQALRSVETLRTDLTRAAIVIAIAAVILALAGYVFVIRPQFARLSRLQSAARQIGEADFALSLPETRLDEIGQIYRETNRMAAALAERRDTVNAEWGRLNDVIAERTEALRAANGRLEEVDRNRRRFFADVSHELRTPLTVILMEAQIGGTGAKDAEAAAAFATIESRAARLNRRIDDLLRVARSDSGMLELEARPEPLSAMLAQVEEEVRAEIDNAGMRLDVAKAHDIAVLCDPNWMRQILVGLIRNAIRHARSGVTLALDAAATPGNAVAIRVRDNGPGIPQAQHDQVFERFAQSGAASKAEGFGIGLALARWVVEEQGGAVALISPVPRARALGDAPGTEITVTVPVVQE